MRIAAGPDLVIAYDLAKDSLPVTSVCVNLGEMTNSDRVLDLQVLPRNALADSYHIRVYFDSLSGDPVLATFAEGRVAIASGQQVYIVATDKPRVIACVGLQVAISALAPKDHHLFVVGEISMLVLDENGRTISEIGTADVIEGFQFQPDGSLTSFLADGSTVSLPKPRG